MQAAARVVVVTGAARGIGYGIAECFAARKDRIVIADLDLAAAEAAAAKLDTEAVGLACNVADRASVQTMIEAVVARFGRIDVLVNNAGICPFVEVMKMSPEVWQKTLDVNLSGAFHCTQLAAEKMIAQGTGGRVVFITSLAENVTGPAQVDYGASKAGMRMTMVGFATALGKHGITCNAIAPGMILTDMTRFHWEKPENAAFLKGRVPVGRIGTPTDIGNAAVFLASPEAAYISGVTLRVDGGHQACCV
ncbi:MAG: SDR family NAD(P)-dependent oxidoreductase [Lentisphaeria bacterium]|jgi:NAD(P)-dependent dehydrogenase (short-subunit alcohol dehydrogenase family)|nr:SDR family NAD(P)-dependent oxidoreductase [Lentisphaeria bacterium]